MSDIVQWITMTPWFIPVFLMTWLGGGFCWFIGLYLYETRRDRAAVKTSPETLERKTAKAAAWADIAEIDPLVEVPQAYRPKGPAHTERVAKALADSIGDVPVKAKAKKRPQVVYWDPRVDSLLDVTLHEDYVETVKADILKSYAIDTVFMGKRYPQPLSAMQKEKIRNPASWGYVYVPNPVRTLQVAGWVIMALMILATAVDPGPAVAVGNWLVRTVIS